MTNATQKYRDRMHRDAQASADRLDPAKMIQSLKLQGIKFVQTQMRTLVFDDRSLVERLKVTNPELADAFILLVREDLESPIRPTLQRAGNPESEDSLGFVDAP